METRCPNCQQPLLAGDTDCWQCSWQLAEPAPAGANTAALTSSAPAGIFAQRPTAWIYTAFTLLLIILGGLLLRQLGQQPLVQVTAGGSLSPGWQRVTTARQTLTLDLPPGWTWLDGEDPTQATAFAALTAQRETLRALTSPLGSIDPDAALLFAAAPGDLVALSPDSITLVVIRSPVLSQLTAEDALAHVEQAEIDLVDARQVPNFDKTHTSFLLEVDMADGARVRCRQQFFRHEPGSLLLAVCGAPQQFRSHAQEIEQILSTVQPLRP